MATAAPALGQAGMDRYVHGSWVNLRTAPERSATVVRQLVVNTPVKLVNEDKSGGFCRVANGDGQEGFLLCRLLGDKPLSHEEVGNTTLPDGKPNPNYSPSRAFWLAPSVATLLAAGQHFESSMLTPERLAQDKALLEASPGKPVLKRFAVPEFEAMKALLHKGVLSGEENQLAPSPWSADSQSPNMFYMDGIAEAIQLPSIKPSYFKQSKEVIGPAISTQAVSRHFAIPYRVIVKSGPKWVPGGHYNDAMQYGAWDVGDTETELLRPVYQYTLHGDKRLTGKPTRVKQAANAPQEADEGCQLQFSYGDASHSIYRAANLEMPKNPGKRLFSIYTATPLPADKSKVTVSRIKLPRKSATHPFIAATMHHVDIDGDGVTDLVAWEGTTSFPEGDMHRPQGDFPDYRAFFANIGGTWHVLGSDQFIWGCGC